MPRPVQLHRRIAWRTFTALAEEAARLRGLEPWQVLHITNKRAPSHTRFGMIWVLRQMDVVFADIAEQLGMSDHTSVIHGMNVATRLRDEDPVFRMYTDDLLAFAKSIWPERDAEAA
jgi:hypothetical protein